MSRYVYPFLQTHSSIIIKKVIEFLAVVLFYLQKKYRFQFWHRSCFFKGFFKPRAYSPQEFNTEARSDHSIFFCVKVSRGMRARFEQFLKKHDHNLRYICAFNLATMGIRPNCVWLNFVRRSFTQCKLFWEGWTSVQFKQICWCEYSNYAWKWFLIVFNPQWFIS